MTLNQELHELPDPDMNDTDMPLPVVIPSSYQFRVIAPSSSYYGQVGTILDKDAVQREVGADLGRGVGWYDYWDVLLDFTPSGVGFLRSELEPVSAR